ncbi:MAG: response regulator, partial [Cyanobacteria bacterium P01_F01_bin.53]
KRKQFPRGAFTKIVECYVTEVLFDIAQAGSLQYHHTGELLMIEHPKDASKVPFVMTDTLQSLSRARQEWKRWSQVGLSKISPDWAPIIKDPQALREQVSPSTFQTLSGFANGDTTLRDLSIKFKQPIIPIAKSILPYVSKQLLEFKSIPDLVDDVTHGFHLDLIEFEREKADNKESADAALEPVISNKTNDDVVKTTQPENSVQPEVTAQSEASGPSEGSVPSEASTPLVEPVPVKTPVQIEAPVSAEAPVQIEAPAEIEGHDQIKDPVEIERTEQLEENASDNLQSLEESESPLSTVSIPPQTVDAKRPSANRSAKGTPRKSSKRKSAKRSQLPTIVHVEDSAFDSRIMASIVGSLGYHYVNISDPLQALPKIIEHKPKLIFLDLIMPIANGYEVCAQIRRMSMFKTTPVIIVTSNNGIIDRVRVKMSGASGFIGKPIQEKKVLKVFKKHLGYTAPMQSVS